VEFFEGDRFVIGQSQTQDRDDFGVLAEVEPPSDVRSGRGGVEAEDMRAGAHSAGDHVLGEGTRGQGLIELRTEREDSGAMAPADQTFGDEFVDGPAQGHPRDAQGLGELAFGWIRMLYCLFILIEFRVLIWLQIYSLSKNIRTSVTFPHFSIDNVCLSSRFVFTIQQNIFYKVLCILNRQLF